MGIRDILYPYFNPITTLVWDIDGVFYNRHYEYIKGMGNKKQRDDFIRINGFVRGLELKYPILSNICHKRGLDELMSDTRTNIIDEDKFYNDCLDIYIKGEEDSSLLSWQPDPVVQCIYDAVLEHPECGSNGRLFKRMFDVHLYFLHKLQREVRYDKIFLGEGPEKRKIADPELHKMVTELKEVGYKFGIMTNEVYHTIRTIMRVFGFNIEDFEMNTKHGRKIFCKETGVDKPDTGSWVDLLKHNPVVAEEVVMIGDKFEKDIMPALMLGMKGILIDDNDYAPSGQRGGGGLWMRLNAGMKRDEAFNTTHYSRLLDILEQTPGLLTRECWVVPRTTDILNLLQQAA